MSAAAWSDDRVSTLSKLWADGLSAAQIARQLGGVSRHAVIGKIHRLGLSGRSGPSLPSRTAKVSKPRLRTNRLALRAPIPGPVCDVVVPAVEPGLIRDLTGLSSHMCRWPIGDPKAETFSFCGRRADGRYCPAHARLNTRPGAAWRVDRRSSGARWPV